MCLSSIKLAWAHSHDKRVVRSARGKSFPVSAGISFVDVLLFTVNDKANISISLGERKDTEELIEVIAGMSLLQCLIICMAVECESTQTFTV